jgi:hypothetical protein
MYQNPEPSSSSKLASLSVSTELSSKFSSPRHERRVYASNIKRGRRWVDIGWSVFVDGGKSIFGAAAPVFFQKKKQERKKIHPSVVRH